MPLLRRGGTVATLTKAKYNLTAIEEARVQFATQAEADRAVAELTSRDRSASSIYNTQPYSGAGCRGWTAFEEGVAMILLSASCCLDCITDSLVKRGR